jgi:mannose-6-phosphate isomerase-like protein (cupin superfamily)
VISGARWLWVTGVPEPVPLETNDCFVLPTGQPFRLASDMTLTPVMPAPFFLQHEQAGCLV